MKAFLHKILMLISNISLLQNKMKLIKQIQPYKKKIFKKSIFVLFVLIKKLVNIFFKYKNKILIIIYKILI